MDNISRRGTSVVMEGLYDFCSWGKIGTASFGARTKKPLIYLAAALHLVTII